MIREVKEHVVDGDVQQNQLRLFVVDEPGAGGANHQYLVLGFDARSNPSSGILQVSKALEVLFQNGPIREVGVNGVTQEVLLAIVIDRLRSFQAGPFASTYNQKALEHCEAGLESLKQRTKDRLARNVEGTNQK